MPHSHEAPSFLTLHSRLHRWHLRIFWQDVGQRPHRCYTGRIDLGVALCIVFLDVLKLGRLAEGRNIPIQSSEPFMKSRIPTADVANVALEVLNIDGVEANDGGVESDVGFGDVGAVVERGSVGSKMGFGTVEGSK